MAVYGVCWQSTGCTGSLRGVLAVYGVCWQSKGCAGSLRDVLAEYSKVTAKLMISSKK